MSSTIGYSYSHIISLISYCCFLRTLSDFVTFNKIHESNRFSIDQKGLDTAHNNKMIVLSMPSIWAGVMCLFSLANGLVYETEDAIIVEGKFTI